MGNTLNILGLWKEAEMAKQTMRQGNGQGGRQQEMESGKKEFRWSESGKRKGQDTRRNETGGARTGVKSGRTWGEKTEVKAAGNSDRKWNDKAGTRGNENADRKWGNGADSRGNERSERKWSNGAGTRGNGNADRKWNNGADSRGNGSSERKWSERAGSRTSGRPESREDRAWGEKAADVKGSRQGKKNNNVNKCPHSKKCGGCMFQGIDYTEQLVKKQGHVIYLLKEFGKVHDIIGMEDPYHYRNKVHAVFDRTRTGQIISGVYEEKSHRVVAIEECQIENKLADAIIGSVRNLCKSFKIRIYDEDTGYGLLRHVLVRTGHESGEVMVVLVLADPRLPSKNNFVKALRKLHPEISTVVINVNDKQTSMVLGERDIVLYGKGYIEDSICGHVFRISPQSFYQVNPTQTEVLYNKAIELAGLTGKERVIDAYCGTGTIGIIASKHAKEVIGVELNKDAVRDAVTNAKLNDIKNIKFYNQDAGKFMTGLAQEGEIADVVFMDPPRTGSDEAFLSSVVKLAPKKLVYVSCNPETLARDMKYLKKHGYEGNDIYPVDMFPFTGHVEVCCLMSRVER